MPNGCTGPATMTTRSRCWSGGAAPSRRITRSSCCCGTGGRKRSLVVAEETTRARSRSWMRCSPPASASAKPWCAARAANTAGWLYGELQDHHRALALNTQSLNLASTITVTDTEIWSNARLNLGDSLAALGRLDEAEEHFQAVEQLVRHPRPEDHWMLWRYAQHLFHSHGELWLVRGDRDRALSYADACLQLAEASESRKNIVKARRLRGQVFLARGALAEAEAEFDRALDTARQIGNPPQLWKTLAAIGELRQAQGRLTDCRQAYHEAMTIIDSVAAGLHDTSLRDTFLASAHVQHIRRS